jgi:general secretion pathway protein N
MTSVWRYVTTAVAAYVLFLVLTAPAAKLLPMFQSQLPAVQLSGVTGTLWSGQAAQLIVQSVPLTGVSWELRPVALFFGAMEYQVEGQLNGQPLALRLGRSLFSGAYVSDISARIAASDLLYWSGLKQVGVNGQLQFNIEEVEGIGGDGLPAVGGTATWIPAMVLAPLELNLGEARLVSRIEAGVTRGQLTAGGGALTLAGELTVNPDGNYQLVAEVQKKGNVPQAVDKFLDTFAEFKNGRYHLEWSDQLKLH